MRKLVWRAEHPVLYKVLHYGVPVALVLAVLWGLLPFFSVQNEPPAVQPQISYAYSLSAQPQGYLPLKTLEWEEGKTFLYLNEEGHLLHFSYERAKGTGELFDNMDAYTEEQVFVGPYEGVFYTTGNGDSNVLIWHDGKMLLRIMGHFNMQQLIALAESIQSQKIPQ